MRTPVQRCPFGSRAIPRCRSSPDRRPRLSDVCGALDFQPGSAHRGRPGFRRGCGEQRRATDPSAGTSGRSEACRAPPTRCSIRCPCRRASCSDRTDLPSGPSSRLLARARSMAPSGSSVAGIPIDCSREREPTRLSRPLRGVAAGLLGGFMVLPVTIRLASGHPSTLGRRRRSSVRDFVSCEPVGCCWTGCAARRVAVETQSRKNP